MNMQTGFGLDDQSMINRYITSMVDIIKPVMERGVILAGEYADACGRDVILPEDMEYAMRYCAMYTVGQGSIIEHSDSDSDSDSESVDLDILEPDKCPEFLRYNGNDEKFLLVNAAYDRWDEWEPQSQIEHMLKNAINSNGHL